MRISDWSSDVCSSDLPPPALLTARRRPRVPPMDYRDNPNLKRRRSNLNADRRTNFPRRWPCDLHLAKALGCGSRFRHTAYRRPLIGAGMGDREGLGIDNFATRLDVRMAVRAVAAVSPLLWKRSEEQTSELQSLMRITYAV